MSALQWATAANLRIDCYDPSDPAASYSDLYRRMYASDPDQGYAYLEQEMAKAEPSYGYSVLGRIMAEHRHRAVITVNFDNLVADSLSIFSKTYPLVCGHESLAQFARTDLRRPLVLKVHRDLLLKPMSDPDELSRVDEGLKRAITGLLGQYTPVVIGYGGNDDSLMACLESIAPGEIPGGIYWCYREGGSPPPLRIRSLVAKQRGFLVPHLGFDEMMVLLGKALGMESPETQVMKRAEDRAKKLKQQLESLSSRLAERASQPITQTLPNDEVRSTRPGIPGNAAASGNPGQNDERTVAELDAVLTSVDRALGKSDQGKPWWQWQREAASEPDTDKREAIYRAAIEALPDSPELLGNYATFLRSVRNDYAKAELVYERALDADPKAVINLGNYANFLWGIRKDHAKAEQLFERALDVDPANAVNLAGYATFLASVRKDHAKAEQLYARALAADPLHATTLGNYATFLAAVRKDHAKAEQLYERALEVDPTRANALCNYASLLTDLRKDHAKAEQLYELALESDPTHTNTLSNFATFLTAVRKDHAKAEQLYERAQESDPMHAGILGSYANFLTEVRKDHGKAEQLYERALESEPTHANVLGNYARLLLSTGRVDRGLATLDAAFANLTAESPAELPAECWMYAYCCRPPGAHAEALAHLKQLIERDSVRTGEWDFSGVIAAAVERGHPNAEWLTPLADVLAGREDVSRLADWEAWRAA